MAKIKNVGPSVLNARPSFFYEKNLWLLDQFMLKIEKTFLLNFTINNGRNKERWIISPCHTFT